MHTLDSALLHLGSRCRAIHPIRNAAPCVQAPSVCLPSCLCTARSFRNIEIVQYIYFVIVPYRLSPVCHQNRPFFNFFDILHLLFHLGQCTFSKTKLTHIFSTKFISLSCQIIIIITVYFFLFYSDFSSFLH